MKERLKNTVRRTTQNPIFRKSTESLKPKRTIWGILSVVCFFILPEIIAFVWGKEITAWAHERTLIEPEEMGRKLYWIIEKIFENGGSFINLGIGIVLLLWLVWDWKKEISNR